MSPEWVGGSVAQQNKRKKTCLIRLRDCEVAPVISSLLLLFASFLSLRISSFTNPDGVVGRGTMLQAGQARNRASIFRAVFFLIPWTWRQLASPKLWNYSPINFVSHPRSLCSSSTTLWKLSVSSSYLTENTLFLHRKNQSVNVV
jgi:hypothetical protein